MCSDLYTYMKSCLVCKFNFRWHLVCLLEGSSPGSMNVLRYPHYFFKKSVLHPATLWLTCPHFISAFIHLFTCLFNKYFLDLQLSTIMGIGVTVLEPKQKWAPPHQPWGDSPRWERHYSNSHTNKCKITNVVSAKRLFNWRH